MKIVCIGDSLTSGHGVYYGECWVDLLRKELKVEVLNKGIDGDSTSLILTRSNRDLIENQPSHAIIMAGSNDILVNYPVKYVKQNMEFLIKETIENDIQPILGLQIPIVSKLAKIYWDSFIDYERVNNDIHEYVDWAYNFAKSNNILYVNFYKKFIELYKSKNVEDYYSDGLHPNALGHELMFHTLIEEVPTFKIKK